MVGDGRPNLVLAGFMGAGKTTCGRLAAELLDMAFLDTDDLVEAQAGMRIGEIFARRGEGAFRALESDICRRTAAGRDSVIATGGGALGNPATRRAFESSGVVVLLSCRGDVLAGRLRLSALNGVRPLLGERPEEEIERLLALREPLYSSIRLKVDTTHSQPAQVAEMLAAIYRQAVVDWRPACSA